MGLGMAPRRFGDEQEGEGLTRTQEIFWQSLTDQRIANIFLIADVIGDAQSDGLAFLRVLGSNSEEHRALRRFLLQAKPETLRFLTELREKEVDDIEEAIETARSIRRTGRVMRWGAVTAAAAFLGMVAIWDKLVLFMGARGR